MSIKLSLKHMNLFTEAICLHTMYNGKLIIFFNITVYIAPVGMGHLPPPDLDQISIADTSLHVQ